jgi:hypothetical protein
VTADDSLQSVLPKIRFKLREPRLIEETRRAIVVGPHFLRHVVSPLQGNDLTHDDGQIATIDFAVGQA